MTFKEYLAGAKVGYDAVGDFVRVARADPGMPDIRSSAELTTYVYGRRDYQSIEAARQAWSNFERSVKEKEREARRA